MHQKMAKANTDKIYRINYDFEAVYTKFNETNFNKMKMFCGRSNKLHTIDNNNTILYVGSGYLY